MLAACGTGSFSETERTQADVLSANEALQLDKEDYRLFIRTMPDDVVNGYIGSYASVREMAIDYHSMKHIEMKAEQQQLHLRDDVRGEIESARRRILNAVYIKEELDKVPRINDENILKERYTALSERLMTPEKRKVAHILITENPPCECVEEEMTYEQRIDVVRAQLEAGESFADVAQQYSADKRTSINGGVIDEWLTQKSKIERPFLDAAFSIAEVGGVSKATKTQFGTHFIKLIDVDEASLPPYEEVRDVVKGYINKEKRNSRLDEIKAASYPALSSIDIEAIEALIKQEKDNRGETNE